MILILLDLALMIRLQNISIKLAFPRFLPVEALCEYSTIII